MSVGTNHCLSGLETSRWSVSTVLTITHRLDDLGLSF